MNGCEHFVYRTEIQNEGAAGAVRGVALLGGPAGWFLIVLFMISPMELSEGFLKQLAPFPAKVFSHRTYVHQGGCHSQGGEKEADQPIDNEPSPPKMRLQDRHSPNKHAARKNQVERPEPPAAGIHRL